MSDGAHKARTSASLKSCDHFAMPIALALEGLFGVLLVKSACGAG